MKKSSKNSSAERNEQNVEVLGQRALKVEVISEPELKYITPKKGINVGEEVAVLSFQAQVLSSEPPIKEAGKSVKPELKVEFFNNKAEDLSEKISEGMQLYLSGFTQAHVFQKQTYYRVYGSFAAVSVQDIESLNFEWAKDEGSEQDAEDSAAESEDAAEDVTEDSAEDEAA